MPLSVHPRAAMITQGSLQPEVTGQAVTLYDLGYPEHEIHAHAEANQLPVDRVLAHQVKLVVCYALHKTVLKVVVLDDTKVDEEVEETGVREDIPDAAGPDQRDY
ncbi:hypothetical protein ACFL6U_28220 [Planctomycetota bacterium]